MKNGQLCHVGINVWIGNWDTCKRKHDEFNSVIHIWHESQPSSCSFEEMHSIPNGKDLAIHYREHDPLSTEILEAVWEHALKPNKLLLHCAAGLGRSPTLTLVALAARGMSVFQGMASVSQAMWEQYQIPHMPSFNCKRLNEIILFVESKVS